MGIGQEVAVGCIGSVTRMAIGLKREYFCMPERLPDPSRIHGFTTSVIARSAVILQLDPLRLHNPTQLMLQEV